MTEQRPPDLYPTRADKRRYVEAGNLQMALAGPVGSPRPGHRRDEHGLNRPCSYPKCPFKRLLPCTYEAFVPETAARGSVRRRKERAGITVTSVR
jgi:hypothetical protein